jgi:hypothetical protein
MAQARASVVVAEGVVAQDIAAIATELALEAGIASAVVDPGAQNIVQVDILADADDGTEGVWILDLDTSDGGTFALVVNGAQTAPIAFDATDPQIKAALEALPNVNTVSIAAGTDDGDITFESPVEDIVVSVVDIDLTNPGTVAIVEDTEAVAGSAAAGAAAIVAAIAAVEDASNVDRSVLYGEVIEVEVPVATISDNTPTLAEDEVAAVDITFALVGSTEARVDAVGLETWMRFTDFGDPVRGSHYRSGQARLLLNPAGADVDGTYVVSVICTDDNGNIGSASITVTVNDPA